MNPSTQPKPPRKSRQPQQPEKPERRQPPRGAKKRAAEEDGQQEDRRILPEPKSGRSKDAPATNSQPPQVVARPERSQLAQGLESFFASYQGRIDSMTAFQRAQADPLEHAQAWEPGEAPVHPAVPRRTIGPDWTREDEVAVLGDWKKEKRMWTVQNSALGYYKTLWKVCLRFAQCTPWDIIGVRHKLVFELDASAESYELQAPNHMWSQTFCDALATLVTHPAWSGSWPGARAAKLALTIQYAVILRTNDRRPWDVSSVNDEFLQSLRGAMEFAPRPVPELHAEVRAAFEADKKDLPVLSQVFSSLEGVVKGAEMPLTGPSAPEAYNVKTSDLTDIAKALDLARDPSTGFPLFGMPAKIINHTIMAARKGRFPPNGDDDVKWHHEAARLEEMRRAIRRTREQHSGNVESPGSSSVWEDGDFSNPLMNRETERGSASPEHQRERVPSTRSSPAISEDLGHMDFSANEGDSTDPYEGQEWESAEDTAVEGLEQDNHPSNWASGDPSIPELIPFIQRSSQHGESYTRLLDRLGRLDI